MIKQSGRDSDHPSYVAQKLRKIKRKIHPITGHESPEGEKRYSSTLSLTSALDGVDSQRYDPAALPPGKTRYSLYRRFGGPQGPVWTGAENLAPTAIRSSDRPALSQSLYQLSYPGPVIIDWTWRIFLLPAHFLCTFFQFPCFKDSFTINRQTFKTFHTADRVKRTVIKY